MTAAMTPDETKYFETSGEAGIPEPVETPTETKPEPVVEKKEEPRMIREEAYRREQDQRRQAEKEARELREQIAYFKGKLEQPQEKPKPVEIPDFSQDPATHLKHKIETVDETLRNLAKSTEEQKRAAEMEATKARFYEDYGRKAREFQRVTPDFAQAYNHALEMKKGELEDAGLEGADLEKTLTQWEEYVVATAMSRGKDPAEAIYKIAKRAGYTGEKKEERPAPQRDPETGKFVSADEKLENIERAQEKGKSLGSLPGAGVTSAPSLEALLSMPRSESAKIVTDEAKWRKLMGADE